MPSEAAWEENAEIPAASLLQRHVSTKPQLPVSLVNTRYITVSRNFLSIINLYVVVTEIAVEAEISDLVAGQHA